MSKLLFRQLLTAVAGIALMIPAFASPQESLAQSELQQLEERLETDPGAVLESLSRLERALPEEAKLQRRLRWLRGQALSRLKRYGDAEKTFKSLLNEMTGDADSPPLLVARTALGLGSALVYLSRPFEGEAALSLALRQLPVEAPPLIRAEILLEITRSLIYMGESVNAAGKALEALEWASHHGLEQRVLRARYLLGYAYRNQDKSATARLHFQRALSDARRLGNLRYEILTMNELGNLLVMEKRLDAAMKVKQKALTKARKAKDAYLIYVCQHDIGHALIARKEYTRALKIYNAILSRETGVQTPRAINMARVNLTYIYSEMGKWRQALNTAEQTLVNVRKHHLGELEPKVLVQIIDLLEKQGRLAEALKRQQELIELQEEMFQRELERKITEIRDRHRLMDQESEIQILRQDKEIRNLQLGRQRILISSMIGLLTLLALLALLALVGYRAKRRANRDLESLNHRLDELSRHDTLTGLSNRRDMMEKLELFKARADRDGSPLTVLMIDMDHFKSINDNQGHELGDRVLQGVARILQERIRSQDLVARWGGEEFLIALADTNQSGALKAAEQLRDAVEQGGRSGFSPDIPVTITLGVAQYLPGEDMQSLITRADDRLYVGKREGRNRVAG